MKLRVAVRFLLKLYFVRVAMAFIGRRLENLSPLSRCITRYFQMIVDRWQHLSHFRCNLLIGLIIALALHFAHDTSLIRETENIVMDAMISVNQRLPRMTGAHHGKPIHFTFINIDENTYRAWNEPFFIPRNKVLRLIQFAAGGGARAIVVDVDFSTPSMADTELLQFLAAYNAAAGPPLVLIRSFYPPSEYTQDRFSEIRPSILDTIQLKQQVFQAIPLFRRSDYDRSVRYWHLWQAGCLNGEAKVLPSVQLIVDILLTRSEDTHDPLAEIARLAPCNCTAFDGNGNQQAAHLEYAQKHIELSTDRVGERLIYTLPWQSNSTEDLVVIPARAISETKFKPADDLVRDRIVVIGASFTDSRDIYITPIGEMPGALIVLNAIKSLYLFGQIKPPSPIIRGLIELALIVLMAWAFARLGSTWGTLVVGAVIVVTLLPISFYFFKYGVWVDLAAPLLGMQFHQLVAKQEEDLSLKKQLKKQSSGDEP